MKNKYKRFSIYTDRPRGIVKEKCKHTLFYIGDLKGVSFCWCKKCGCIGMSQPSVENRGVWIHPENNVENK